MKSPAIILSAALLTASCAAAPVAWEQPGGSNDQWIKDKVACQYNARRKAEKDFRQHGGDTFTTEFETDTLSQNMARYDVKRDERRLFEDCLKGRGYAKKKTRPE